MSLNSFSTRSQLACSAYSLVMVLIALAATLHAADPVAKKADEFPLEFRIVDPDNPKNASLAKVEDKLPPLIIMFPEGKTADKVDATAPIGRLEGFRGKSKMLPASNDDPGLPVLLYGLRFLERKGADGKLEGYDVELQGEFNAVKVSAPTEAMADFLAGKKATFVLESKLQYGIISTQSQTKLEMSRSGDQIFIYSVEGDFTFREAFTFYKSATLKTETPTKRKYLYLGEKAKLPTLRIL